MTARSAFELRSDEHGCGQILIPRGPWNDACSERIKAGGIAGVRLSYSMGFRGADVGFLLGCQGIRSIEIYSPEVADLNPVAELEGVEVLGLQPARRASAKRVAERLGTLRVALLQWGKGMEGFLEVASLQYLNVINYPHVNLEPLHALARLERLGLTSRRLSSLRGIHHLGALKHLDLYDCPDLLSVAEADACAALVRLEVEACRHITRRP